MTLITNRLAELHRKLEKAKARLAEAEEASRKAKRREDAAYAAVGELQYEIDMQLLAAWGDKPDLQALLNGGDSMVFYQALTALAEFKGLGVMGRWSDTNQTSLWLKLNRSEIGAIERVKSGIQYFAPAIKSSKGGGKRFGIHQRDSSSCAWEMLYSPKGGRTHLVRMHYSHEDERLTFPSLEKALEHVETHLWCEDVIDAAPAALLEHVEQAEEETQRE